MSKVTVDFSHYADYPLINHKFALYICTYVDADRILRDVPLMEALDPYAVRYDPGWGFGNDDKLNSPRELNAPQISGSAVNLQIDFTDYDRIVKAIQDSNIHLMLVQGYNPIPLQQPAIQITEGNATLGMRSSWNTMPTDLGAWYEINKRYAAHFKALIKGKRFYEIWNEPDLQPVFFTGTKDEYNELYRHGSLAIRSADPEAKVGGPALANAIPDDDALQVAAEDWAAGFLEFVQRENLPIDYFSYHNYAAPEFIVPAMRDIIGNRVGMEMVETIITEYNSFKPGTRNFTIGGEIERHHLAWRLLNDFKYYLEQPDISCVYWAQFNDPEVFGDGVDRCGLLSLDGTRKAGYNAWELFARMPADRVAIEIDDERLDGLASIGDHRGSVLIWNKADKAIPFNMRLDNIPIANAEASIYQIDAWRCSHIDNLCSEKLSPSKHASIVDGMLTISDMLLVQSVYCVEFEIAQAEIQVASIPKATDIRRQYYDRLKPCYAEYDHHESAVYLGMGKASGTCGIGLTFTDTVNAVTMERRGADSGISGVYGFVVYSKETGQEKSVLYYAGDMERAQKLVSADESKKLHKAKTVLETGTTRLWFFMCDMPHETKVKFSLRGD